jgi:formylglycine-generating enzyme
MKYTLQKPIGEGSAAVSFLAQDEKGRSVLIKRFKTALFGKTEEYWLREANLLKSISHPQIPRYIDQYVAEVEGRRLAHLVQEFVEGQSLSNQLQKKKFTETEIIHLLADLLQILSYLHSLRPCIIHRDIKPSNILLRDNNEVVLIDFGLAINQIKIEYGQTMAVGTIGYQAPEQIRGEATIRSDLYSVGVLAVQLLTMEDPSSLLDGMRLRWEQSCLHLSLELQRWLEKVLAFAETDRFPDAQKALMALNLIQPSEQPEIVINSALRASGDAPSEFLNLLSEELDMYTAEEREKRKLALKAKENEQAKAEKQRSQRLEEQRKQEQQRIKQAKIEAQLAQMETKLHSEMWAAWKHVLVTIGSQKIPKKRILDVFCKSYEQKLKITYKGTSRNVESGLFLFAKKYRKKETLIAQSHLYVQILEKQLSLSLETDQDLQFYTTQIDLLKPQIKDVTDEIESLNFLEQLFQKTDLEEQKQQLMKEKDELFSQQKKHKKELITHFWNSHWYLFYDDLPNTEKLEYLWKNEQFSEKLDPLKKRIGKQFEFRLIHSGSFMMGGIEGDKEANSNEKPSHKVVLSHSFYMSRYPVTQKWFQEIQGKNPSYFSDNKESERFPVESVSWADSILFCNKMSLLTGLKPVYSYPKELLDACANQSETYDDRVDSLCKKVTINWQADGYRLPTEAEWECVAKAASATIYSGSNNIDEVAWYGYRKWSVESNKWINEGKGNSNKRTHPVGKKKTNPWGFYDLSGNVYEWCNDWYASNYNNRKKQDSHGPSQGKGMVVRGGSWYYAPCFSRVTERGWRRPSTRLNRIGFRILRTVPSQR